jgi:hypothetical protein
MLDMDFAHRSFSRQLTLAIKRPKAPPRPKPMVPEMTVLIGQDSIPRCIYTSLIRIGRNTCHNRRRTILTIACSCSFIPWVPGLPPREAIGIAVPVVPGNAMLIVDVGKVWIEYGRISYSVDWIQDRLNDQSTGPRREKKSREQVKSRTRRSCGGD